MNPNQHYTEEGYVIFRGLIPEAKIDRLLQHYRRDIVPSQYPFFRQNTNAYEKNELTAHGFVKQSFLDIHDYGKFRAFSLAALEIFASAEMQTALKETTGYPAFNMMQSMFFDANTETCPHQDWWYLDSVPNGELLACWVALEDIDEKAGRFYVIPRTTTVDLHSDTPDLPHSLWLKRMAAYLEENRARVRPADLKKGDVIFWNSRLVHGSLPTRDPAYSRKSLTAHFLPAHLKFGNLFTTKEFVTYKSYKGLNYYKNQPDYSLTNALASKIKVSVYDSPQAMRLVRSIQKLVR